MLSLWFDWEFAFYVVIFFGFIFAHLLFCLSWCGCVIYYFVARLCFCYLFGLCWPGDFWLIIVYFGFVYRCFRFVLCFYVVLLVSVFCVRLVCYRHYFLRVFSLLLLDDLFWFVCLNVCLFVLLAYLICCFVFGVMMFVVFWFATLVCCGDFGLFCLLCCLWVFVWFCLRWCVGCLLVVLFCFVFCWVFSLGY